MSTPSPVPFRRPRPREKPPGLLALGALLGGALAADKVIGATVGAALGGLITQDQPVPLEKALRDALAPFGATLVSMYRLGPAHVRVLFNYQAQFWTIESTAPHTATQEELDDWLFGDLIDYQLQARVAQAQGGGR